MPFTFLIAGFSAVMIFIFSLSLFFTNLWIVSIYVLSCVLSIIIVNGGFTMSAFDMSLNYEKKGLISLISIAITSGVFLLNEYLLQIMPL